ncbi:reverse transcriptase domain-containing protein [Tanacetum coccineum]
MYDVPFLFQKCPLRRATGENENPPDIATLLAQQLQNLLPEIVNQVTASVNANANNGNGNGANGGNGGNVAKLVPHLVTPESARIKRYMAGLAPEIRGMLKATQPATNQSAILKAERVVREKEKEGVWGGGDMAWKASRSGRDVKKAKGGTNFVAATPSREGPGHFVRDCRSQAIPAAPVNVVDARPNQKSCNECGNPNHLRYVCPKLNRESGQSRNQLALGWRCNDRGGRNQVRGRAYNANMNTAEAIKDSSVVTSTFSINDHFATVLFDSGADFSFISTKFTPMLNVKPSIANPGYVIEIADGKKVEVDRIIYG